mmetsp:Transcript_6/g.20  ORF Transcript_6/g.20 Transcript_6/m.20 type:complete len:83 (+) Transcript_6:570-818(+)
MEVLEMPSEEKGDEIIMKSGMTRVPRGKIGTSRIPGNLADKAGHGTNLVKNIMTAKNGMRDELTGNRGPTLTLLPWMTRSAL